MKRAAAFRRGTKIFLMPYVKTTEDKWMLHPPVFTMEVGDPAAGAAVLEVLYKSRTDVPAPPDGTVFTGELLYAAQVRSMRAFFKGMTWVELLRHEDKVAFIPTRDQGNVNLRDKGTIWPADETDVLTELLHDAFEDCE